LGCRLAEKASVELDFSPGRSHLVARKNLEQRRNELKAQKKNCDEKIKRLEAQIAARTRDGAMTPKAAEKELEKLLGQREVILSQMAKHKRAQDTHSKCILGGILKRHIENHAGEPFLPREILEALMADNGAARNSDLIGLALLLQRNVPGASLEEFTKWASSPKDYLWVKLRPQSKTEPRSAAPTAEPLTPAQPQPAAPMPPEDPIERAEKDPAYWQEFTTQLKKEWSKTFASNEWVLSQELSYLQSEMDRETRMFKHSMEELDGEEAKLRENLQAQKGVFKKAKREQIEQQIKDVDRRRDLSIQSHERNLESFTEEANPERVLQKVFSDTKGQKPELFAQMSALGIAPG
jgi:hypothetical protein